MTECEDMGFVPVSLPPVDCHVDLSLLVGLTRYSHTRVKMLYLTTLTLNVIYSSEICYLQYNYQDKAKSWNSVVVSYLA